MGQRESLPTLRDFEVKEFCSWTAFSAEDIKSLYVYYKRFASIEKDDGVINYKEFCNSQNLEDTQLTKRFFKIFDENEDMVINFREFVLGLSQLQENQVDAQIELLFRIFDYEDKEYVTINDFRTVFLQLLKIYNNVFLDEVTIENLITTSFQQSVQEVLSSPLTSGKSNEKVFHKIKEQSPTEEQMLKEALSNPVGLKIDLEMFSRFLKTTNSEIFEWLHIDRNIINQNANTLNKK